MNLLLDTHAFLWFIPFDRLLIAQAMVEGMPIVSSDPAFEAYDIQKLW